MKIDLFKQTQRNQNRIRTCQLSTINPASLLVWLLTAQFQTRRSAACGINVLLHKTSTTTATEWVVFRSFSFCDEWVQRLNLTGLLLLATSWQTYIPLESPKRLKILAKILNSLALGSTEARLTFNFNILWWIVSQNSNKVVAIVLY